MTKQTKRINLSDLLSGLPNKDAAKDIAGRIIVDSIKESASRTISPVKGRGKFQGLSKDYKKIKSKAGKGTSANLLFDGDLLSSLESHDVSTNVIEVGIFDDSGQAPKADGHNNLSGKSSLPTRRFIPSKGEEFKVKIMREVKTTIDLLRDEAGLEKALGRLLSGN